MKKMIKKALSMFLAGAVALTGAYVGGLGSTTTAKAADTIYGGPAAFQVGFNYVSDSSWTEQTWGDKTVNVVGDGDYSVSYTAQQKTDDIFMMILSTNLYGEQGKSVKLVAKSVTVGTAKYDLTNNGNWCYSDGKDTNAWRYNIENPYNGPSKDDGLTPVDETVTSLDSFGKAVAVNAGDVITVDFSVSGTTQAKMVDTGSMKSFGVGFNYVSDGSWTEQSWGDNYVTVDRNGTYMLSYKTTAATDDIFMMILNTNLKKGSLATGFELKATKVDIAGTSYDLTNNGNWCYSDGKDTNPWRYNIENPYNGPSKADGLTPVDETVTSIDSFGKAVTAKAGDVITVYFTVSGMDPAKVPSTAAKTTLSVSKKSVTVAAGKSVTLTYKASDAKKVTVSSANKKVATVKKSNGKITISVPKTAKKGASTTVTLKLGSKKVTVKVTVKK